MKNILFLFVVFLGIFQCSLAQSESKGAYEVSMLGADFANRTSFGVGFAAGANWHEYFHSGVSFQFAFNTNSSTFGYEVGSPMYSFVGFTFHNAARFYSKGNFSIEANANFGWLFINLSDDDFAQYNPALDVYEAESIASESFRLLQGGFTFNYIISKKIDRNISIFARVLKNQALGNVRFGGENANSNYQFNLGVKFDLF